MRVARALAVGCALVMVAACAPQEAPASESDRRIDRILAMVDDDVDVSADQQEVIDRVADGEPLLFEDYAQLVEQTLECARDMGLVVEGPWQVTSLSLPVYDWGWSDPEWDPDGPHDQELNPDRTLSIGEGYCRAHHSFHVEMLYLNQPAAIDDHWRQVDTFRPQLLECLDEWGPGVEDPAMPIQDLWDYIIDLHDDPEWQGADCIEDVEVSVGS